MLLPSHNFNLLPRDDKGLSLLEIVVAVAIIAVFAVVGILGFQKFTDNARQAATDTVASDTFTMAMAIDAGLVSAKSGSSTLIHASLVQVNAPSTEAATLAKLQEEVNKENTEVRVSIVKDQQDITVTAYGWEDRYVSVKSTINEYNGMKTPPPFEENDTDITPVNNDPFSGDINDYQEGIFEFTISQPTRLPVMGVSRNATITHNGETKSIPSQSIRSSTNRFIDLPEAGTYTLRGGFYYIGQRNGHLKLEDIAPRHFISIDKWENTGTVNISGLFAYTSQDLQINAAPPSTLQNTSRAFVMSEFNQDISDWNMHNVTNASGMFNVAMNFNNGDAPGEGNTPLDWDTSNLQYTNSMFNQTKSFNQDLNSWDMSNVVSMESMFSGASLFNNGDEPGSSKNPLRWDTSNTKSMSAVFQNTDSFNQNIGFWDVSSATTLNHMFRNAKSFNQDLSSWKPNATMGHPNFFSQGAHREFAYAKEKHPRFLNFDNGY